MVKNLMHHNMTKHIDVKHHFLRDNIEMGTIYIQFYTTEDQVTNILTKTVNNDQFDKNRLKLGIIKLNLVARVDLISP